MSNRVYVAKTSVCFTVQHGSEFEQNVVLTFVVHPGDQPEVEIKTARLTSFCDQFGTEVPSWLMNRFECDDELHCYLLEKANAENRSDRDEMRLQAHRDGELAA